MRILGTLDICGHPYSVQEGTAEDCPTLSHASGCCDHDHQVLWIHSAQTVTNYRDTIVHEVMHALWTESGLDDVMMAATRWTRDSAELAALEETTLRILVPHLIRAMQGIGGLQTADAPKRRKGKRRAKVK